MIHTAIFLRDNPDLMKVSESENKNLLKWAHEQKYIKLVKFEGVWYFKKEQLDQAVMWESKLGLKIAEDQA